MRSKTDPFEFILCLVFGLIGILQLTQPPIPAQAAAAQIDHTSLTVWLVLITAGCITTFFGLATPYVWGYLVEQVGLVAVGAALISYGVQITVVQIEHHLLSPITLSGGPLLACIGAGFLWKMNQVRVRVRDLPKNGKSKP